MIAFIFSLIFAVIHILAGTISTFPTYVEQHIWLILSLAILIVTVFFGHIYLFYQGRGPILSAKFFPLLAGIYVLARIILFLLGFATLRRLPPGVLNIIHWPHYILIFIGN